VNAESKDGIFSSFDDGYIIWKGVLSIDTNIITVRFELFMGAGATAKKKKVHSSE
jgi:hypothetical protein